MDEKDRLIIEIIQLAYLVQKHTEFCVFIRYSGHVDTLEVDIRASKQAWQTEILKTEIRLKYQEYYEQHDPLRDLKSKRDILAKIINEQEIPMDEINIEQYLVEEYTF